jgi:hypothetical protein
MAEPSIPAPIDTWARVLVRVGVPAAIALYLVYRLAGDTATKLEAVSVKLDAHQSEMTRLSIEDRADRLISRALLRAICRNSADNDAERTNCEVGQ